MSLAQFNQRHEIEVTAYNETETERQYGGIVSRGKGSNVTIRILYMHLPNTREVRKPNGQRFKEDGFKFQISEAEETEKSFTVEAGKTFIIRNNHTYRVVEVKDYTMYKLTQAKQCLATRLIPIDV
jgi:hypothetical protein